MPIFHLDAATMIISWQFRYMVGLAGATFACLVVLRLNLF